MLNYVWLGLVIIGIAVAISSDVIDQSNNKYRNGNSITVVVRFEQEYDDKKSGVYDVTIVSDPHEFSQFYEVDQSDSIFQKARITSNIEENVSRLYMQIDESTPAIWKEMATVSGKKDDLMGSIEINDLFGVKTAAASIVFEEITFKKLKDVTNSALDYAGVAVNIAIGLIGIMALWLGVMKVAEEAGLIKIIAKTVRPLTKFLFPDVPYDHPAMGSMIMNISANMLGLGNAATPFGLKAMEELDELNPEKGTATNAMCTFLAVNTAGLTLIPVTAIAVRAAAGSANPAIIIGTSIFGATCATIVGITATKIFEKFPIRKGELGNWFKSNLKGLMIFLAIIALVAIFILTGLFNLIFSNLSFFSVEGLKTIINIISIIAIPALIFVFIGYGALKRVKVYETFVEGAKGGFDVAIKIIPYLVAMLVAIGIFRAGGGMDFLIIIIRPLTDFVGMPPEALPMAIMRPLSGSGSLGIMAETISVHGPDSFIGILVSTFFGSTETTFYVLAVYFGSVNIKKTRHALPAGLLADIAGILGAVFIVRLLFGG